MGRFGIAKVCQRPSPKTAGGAENPLRVLGRAVVGVQGAKALEAPDVLSFLRSQIASHSSFLFLHMLISPRNTTV